MQQIIIQGHRELKGIIPISGAKNAALPLLTAALLTDKPVTLKNLPRLMDVHTLLDLLQEMGVNYDFFQDAQKRWCVTLNAGSIKSTKAPYELVRKMRASFLVLGPLVARMHHAEVSVPGGCAIGTRPIDFHVEGLRAMGAEIELADGYVCATAPKTGLPGGEFTFNLVSVTGTANLLMAATLAKGRTILRNCALEPEVTNLAECLVKMGAKIQGIGTSTLTIEGVDTLHGCEHDILPDRIETGTYAIAAAATHGRIELQHTSIDLLPTFIESLNQVGVKTVKTDLGFVVEGGERYSAIDVQTQPYPGYPTDLQAQLAVLLCFAEGTSTIEETIFSNRFNYIPELLRMGADIQVNDNKAHIKGVDALQGAEVMATDLRASASLVIAGLCAQGETHVNRIYHLKRGYENLVEKLTNCGAEILERENT